MRKEYDFSKGIKDKYAAKYKAGTNIVLLDPDVAKVARLWNINPVYCSPLNNKKLGDF